MKESLPRILSPNLGCPFILTLEEFKTQGFDLVWAEEEESSSAQLALVARPSYPGEGEEFTLEVRVRERLMDGTLPAAFASVEATRFLISTTLASSIFASRARFYRGRAKPASALGDKVFRLTNQQPRPTLYDLFLIRDGKTVNRVFHALCLHPSPKGLRFIHLTDIHVALRNDLFEKGLQDGLSYPPSMKNNPIPFNNFNANLRKFIRHANELADRGELDFVLMLGDLIDFMAHGIGDREDFRGNNWGTLTKLLLGLGNEGCLPEPNPGLKVPVFTSLGNHDWRFYPYDPGVQSWVYGLEKDAAQKLNFLWADEQGKISQKTDSFYEHLIKRGSFLSNRTWWGWLINVILLRLEKWQVKLLAPSVAAILVFYLTKFPAWGESLNRLLGTHADVSAPLAALVIVSIVHLALVGGIKWFLRKRITDLVAIEAGWQALQDYFLNVNPYFNYAFRFGEHSFFILDTGHDCIRAQVLWDDGDKKLGPISIRDNLIGNSPDSMAFYGANPYYPYSQITWIRRLMERIADQKEVGQVRGRIFVGLHAPPINLSPKERKRADELAAGQPEGVLLPEGEFNARYGTVNHYVSQFLHLCLGRLEQDPGQTLFPFVDMVFAGHAHWKLEVRLRWGEEKKGPEIYYGDFTGDPAFFNKNFDRLRPFVLQTPASGPKEENTSAPPYCRRIEVDDKGNIVSAEVISLA